MMFLLLITMVICEIFRARVIFFFVLFPVWLITCLTNFKDFYLQRQISFPLLLTNTHWGSVLHQFDNVVWNILLSSFSMYNFNYFPSFDYVFFLPPVVPKLHISSQYVTPCNLFRTFPSITFSNHEINFWHHKTENSLTISVLD